MATLSFSGSDLKSLRAVNDALLDPLSYPTTEAWMLEVGCRYQTLCHAPAGFAAFTFTNGPARFVSRDMPQKHLDRMEELALSESGRLGAGAPSSEHLMDELRRRVSGVATTADLLGPAKQRVDDLQDSPMFRDVAFPLGVPGSTLIFHSGASGEFMVHAAYPDINHRAFGALTEQILGTLLPALGASFGALARLGDARRAIGTLLDALEDGAVVFDSGARNVLERNAAMNALVREEPDRAGLERVVLQAAMPAAWHGARSKPGVAEPGAGALARGWRSASGMSYRLRAVRLAAGSLTAQEAILVVVQRLRPAVADVSELMQRFRLTRREAEVAHRLAYGRSDREVATELGLSAHTVRHHAEAVFTKLGVTSRKALALHLATASRPA